MIQQTYNKAVQEELVLLGASSPILFSPTTYFTAWANKNDVTPKQAAETIHRCDDQKTPTTTLDFFYEGVAVGSGRNEK